jgi:Protein of unknown function (DUF3592)
MAGAIGTNPAWRARRRRVVLPPLLLAVTLLALAGWAYANQTTAARHAISTTAVIEDLGQGPGHESQTGERTAAQWGTVRYQVNGSDVRARVGLGECRSAWCPPYHRGDRVTVAYHPDRVTDAELVAYRGGRYPVPDARVVILGALGGLCLLVVIFYLVHGP